MIDARIEASIEKLGPLVSVLAAEAPIIRAARDNSRIGASSS
jgi:hypothetical protein